MKITVITVAYNSAATIGDTLDSVARQSYSDKEHLVIDGASKDDTVAVARAHSTPDTVIVSEPDKGIYDAMNKGFRLARGEVIGFLNADDLFADNEVLARVSTAFEDPSVEACFGDLVYVTGNNDRVVRYWKSRPYRKGSFARGWCPAHPTFYIRRSALERLGPFDLTYRLAADTEFMIRYLERSGVRSVYIPQVQVRMRVGGATNRSLGNIAKQNLEIFDALEKNRISYSRLVFFVRKVASRVWQRWASSRAGV
ncbi:glycosyltransferase family 2 protein [Hydrogenophaga crocea]|uniref:Glycosyltransferase n=1 Tax=Hydrogenophaga crocea TaxID=2716225 RepID=A0A6G8IL87_9BURK|nr:glycosyltransferase family 2 protein [Hydrogenophaga crocea]QIM53977.1 glycosyltransferase [Hydrogenophaga crocea]